MVMETAFAHDFEDKLASPKALWLTRNSRTVNLMARTGSTPVSLDVELGSNFKARVVLVDRDECHVYVRPLAARRHYEALEEILSEVDMNTCVKPAEITPGFVYLMKRNTSAGGSFRGIITKEERSKHYKVFDVDTGLVTSVRGEDVVELPPTLRTLPPLVLCLAVPSTVVDTRAPDLLQEDSIVVCRFDSERMVCVKGAYPPVLIGGIQVENSSDEASQVYTDHHIRRIFGRFCSLETINNVSESESDVEESRNNDFENGEKMGCVGSPTSQFTFVPFTVSLPCQVVARVSRKISFDFYAMRDTNLLVDLYEFIKRPMKRVEIPRLTTNGVSVACIARTARPTKKEARLYRALAKNFDPTRGTCMAYLIDYDQSVECDISSLFDITEQPPEVRKMPTAAFFFNVKSSTSGRGSIGKSFQMRQGDLCNVYLMTKQNGSYTGTVSFPASALSRRQFDEEDRQEDHRRMRGEDGEDEARGVDIRKMEAELKERAESLRREREIFELAKRKRTQELSLVTMQLQVANISRKMDIIATSGFSNGTLGLFEHPILNATLTNAFMQHQQWQQTTSHTVNSVGAQSINQAVINMQQMLLGQQGNVMFGSCSAPASDGSAMNGQSDGPSGPFVRLPESTCPSSSPSTTAYSRSVVSDVFNGDTRSEVCPPSETWSRNLPKRPSRRPLQFVNSRLSDRMESKTPFGARSSYASYNEHRHGSGDYGEIPKQPERKFRWPKKDRDARFVNGSHSSSRNSPREYYSRRGEGSRYPRKGNQITCTFCQEEGHLASNCPSNRALHSDPRREDHRWGGLNNFNGESQSTFEQDARSEQTFYVSRPRDRDGNLLYTSDESSESEMANEVPSDVESGVVAEDDDSKEKSNGPTSDTQLSPAPDEELVPAIIFSAGHLIKALKYEPYFEYVKVNKGQEYIVKRSDEDRTNINWPLFFVHVQKEELLDFLEQHLDSLQPKNDLPDERVVLGTLCISYCMAFEANFRAVITNINGDEVEVLYVDYGNYETVQRNQLKSIDDQPEETRVHPAMAIPCILSGLDDGYMNGGGDLEEEDVLAMKMDVSCDREHFRLKFLNRRPDGVCVAEVARD
uniref:Tudor domain-containing protein n=2 Tax=Parascaris univalens TaxID=6257 RepID=A0A914ZDQ5_PARUN